MAAGSERWIRDLALRDFDAMRKRVADEEQLHGPVHLQSVAMEVLSSRILLSPTDFAASRRWYTDILGLHVYRKYGVDGRVTGVVLFCGGGFLELTSAAPRRPIGPIPVTIWLQVPDVAAEHARLAATGEVTVTASPE